ncbi:hypothetical protein GCM10027168_11890 [Streptomyces capparidis]
MPSEAERDFAEGLARLPWDGAHFRAVLSQVPDAVRGGRLLVDDRDSVGGPTTAQRAGQQRPARVSRTPCRDGLRVDSVATR